MIYYFNEGGSNAFELVIFDEKKNHPYTQQQPAHQRTINKR